MKRITVFGGVLTACLVLAAGAAWRTRGAEAPGVATPAAGRAAERPGAASAAASGADLVGATVGAARAPRTAGIAGPMAAASEPVPGEPGPEQPAAAAGRALPWLHGFAAAAVSAEASARVVERMARWRAPDPACSAAAYGGLALAADVAPAPGSEEVLASYTQGVLVLDAAGRMIASAPPPGCQGSADDLDAIAVGDAQLGEPVIALAATAGGYHASSTWLGLYRVVDGAVVPLFTAMVEDRVGDRTRTGEVTLLPGALLYRAPSGEQTLWVYRPEQHRYVEQALVLPPAA